MATQNHRGQVIVELLMASFLIVLFVVGAVEFAHSMNKVQATARFQNATTRRFK